MYCGLPCSSAGIESACNAGDLSSFPALGIVLGEGHDNPVFLPGEFHGQRSLLGYSPWGGNEWDRTERLTHIYTHIVKENKL